MEIYLNVLKRSAIDILDVDEINNIIEKMEISENSKRIYAYYYKKFLKNNNYQNLVLKVKSYKQQSKKVEALSESQVCQIRKLLLSNLERYVFEIFLITGIRIGEYDDLINSQISENTVYFYCKKNKKWRYAAITDELIELQNSINKNLSRKQIRTIFDKISNLAYEKQIISFKLTPHTMRHTCGSLLRVRGVDYDEIADYLADEVSTVRKYYITLNRSYMKQVGLSLTNRWDEIFDLATARKIINRQKRKLIVQSERIKFLEDEIKNKK